MSATDPSPDSVAPATTAAAEEPATAPERRLHPWSWLFVMLQQVKQFLLPLVVLLVFGRGDRNELWGLVVVVVMAVVSVWRYYTYRYRIERDSLFVRSGLFERTLRQIPFARIHNVALHQTLLHRLFGVAEVRLESAGGQKPEAEMRVLRLSDASALEALVRRHARTTAQDRQGARSAEPNTGTEADAADDVRDLLRLPPSEVVRLGLISNRGMLVVGAGIAAVTQINPDLIADPIENGARTLVHWLGMLHLGAAQWVAMALLTALLLLAVLQLLSVALAFLQYGGFRLFETGTRLTIERGLLTRVRTSAPRRRIQAWTLREGVLYRLFGRRALLVDTATSRQQDEKRAFRELAPVATPGRCDALVDELLPHVAWPPQDWERLDRSAGWRMAVPGAVFALSMTAALCLRYGMPGLAGLLWLPWALFAAHRNARRAGYALGQDLVTVREGWWSRRWRFAELDKLQALRLSRSPMDRWFGTASLWLDTAGAGGFAPLRVRFMPLARAQALLDTLAAEIARRPLRW